MARWRNGNIQKRRCWERRPLEREWRRPNAGRCALFYILLLAAIRMEKVTRPLLLCATLTLSYLSCLTFFFSYNVFRLSFSLGKAAAAAKNERSVHEKSSCQTQRAELKRPLTLFFWLFGFLKREVGPAWQNRSENGRTNRKKNNRNSLPLVSSKKILIPSSRENRDSRSLLRSHNICISSDPDNLRDCQLANLQRKKKRNPSESGKANRMKWWGHHRRRESLSLWPPDNPLSSKPEVNPQHLDRLRASFDAPIGYFLMNWEGLEGRKPLMYFNNNSTD